MFYSMRFRIHYCISGFSSLKKRISLGNMNIFGVNNVTYNTVKRVFIYNKHGYSNENKILGPNVKSSCVRFHRIQLLVYRFIVLLYAAVDIAIIFTDVYDY